MVGAGADHGHAVLMRVRQESLREVCLFNECDSFVVCVIQGININDVLDGAPRLKAP